MIDAKSVTAALNKLKKRKERIEKKRIGRKGRKAIAAPVAPQRHDVHSDGVLVIHRRDDRFAIYNNGNYRPNGVKIGPRFEAEELSADDVRAWIKERFGTVPWTEESFLQRAVVGHKKSAGYPYADLTFEECNTRVVRNKMFEHVDTLNAQGAENLSRAFKLFRRLEKRREQIARELAYFDRSKTPTIAHAVRAMALLIGVPQTEAVEEFSVRAPKRKAKALVKAARPEFARHKTISKKKKMLRTVLRDKLRAVG